MNKIRKYGIAKSSQKFKRWERLGSELQGWLNSIEHEQIALACFLVSTALSLEGVSCHEASSDCPTQLIC